MKEISKLYRRCLHLGVIIEEDKLETVEYSRQCIYMPDEVLYKLSKEDLEKLILGYYLIASKDTYEVRVGIAILTELGFVWEYETDGDGVAYSLEWPT